MINHHNVFFGYENLMHAIWALCADALSLNKHMSLACGIQDACAKFCPTNGSKHPNSDS